METKPSNRPACSCKSSWAVENAAAKDSLTLGPYDTTPTPLSLDLAARLVLPGARFAIDHLPRAPFRVSKRPPEAWDRHPKATGTWRRSPEHSRPRSDAPSWTRCPAGPQNHNMAHICRYTWYTLYVSYL